MKEGTLNPARSESLKIIRDLELSQGLIRIIYQGKCMSPTLRNEDLLLIQPCGIDDVRLGDIVVYRSKEVTRVHRFILRKKTGNGLSLITSPDNTCREPELCFPEGLIGRVLFIRRDRKLIDFGSLSTQILSFYMGTKSLVRFLIYKVGYRLNKAIGGMIRGIN